MGLREGEREARALLRDRKQFAVWAEWREKRGGGGGKAAEKPVWEAEPFLAA